MQCPKCQFDHPLQTTECLKCGVIFAKYEAFQAAVAAVAPVQPPEPEISAEAVAAADARGRRELISRIVALPAALLFGWAVVNTMPMLSSFLRMWTHETGHAITAWMCGYMALPTAWFTIISPERVPIATLLLAAGLVAGAYIAWRFQRWFWVAVCGSVLILMVAGNMRTPYQAHALFTFGGDGGSFVVATILMATFYSRPESTMYRRQLRWAFLLIGAIAFMDTYATWAGGFEKIAGWLEDTDERGPSDLQQLTQMYGWAIGEMQLRFLRIAHLCFVAMGAMYAVGIAQALRWRGAETAKRAAADGAD